MLLFEQDDKYSYANGAKDNAIEMFDSKQLPIKKAVAENFAVFNHLHGSVPSFSTPNHLFWASATSCGLSTNPTSNCSMNSWTQATIFDSLNASKVPYKMYSNSTSGACVDALQGVARHKHACFDQGEFYKDAAAGTLPAFSFVSPPGEACDHPCHDIAKGERLLKDMYEALRRPRMGEHRELDQPHPCVQPAQTKSSRTSRAGRCSSWRTTMAVGSTTM